MDRGSQEQSSFQRWRSRRLSAISSELGVLDKQLFEPAVAIELSDGCSIGCWFCAFAVHKLKGVLDYNTHKQFFRSIISQCLDLLGEQYSETALLYHGTEPYDNPGYLNFMRDYEGLMGKKLFTSTAAHDLDWISQLIGYYKNDMENYLRVNIFSLEVLEKIKTRFTAEELLGVELSVKMKGAKDEFACSGRLLKEHDDLRSLSEGENPRSIKVPRGSIGGVNGFVINLVKRTIRLISSCYACDKWPYGYRVFDEAVFHDEKDFTEIMKKMIAQNMFMTPPKDKILSFRDDMIFRSQSNGFDLIAPNQIHYFQSKAGSQLLGELIAEGGYTAEQIQDLLIKKQGTDPFISAIMIQRLFDKGYINEVYRKK